MINEIQKLEFELIKHASFNDFNGEMVVKELTENRDLWLGAIMDRESYRKDIDLIKLRDIKDGYWNVDTLYIQPRAGKEDELEALAKGWRADEVEWIGIAEAQDKMGYYNGEANPTEKALLRVWWD